MENTGFIFGVIDMSFGIMGLVFSIISMGRINEIEKKLKNHFKNISE